MYSDVNTSRQEEEMAMATETTAVSQSRRMRWRRSAWHRLLVAVDARAAAGALPLAPLLGVDQARLQAWLDAKEVMSPRMQWQLVHIGEACSRDDQPLVRAAHALRAQLEATAAFVDRGPLNSTLTVEAVRAMHS
jgi:hypothetical protein